MQGFQHCFHKGSLKRGLWVKLSQTKGNRDLGTFLGETPSMNIVPNEVLSIDKVFWKTMCTYLHWSHITYTYSKQY